MGLHDPRLDNSSSVFGCVSKTTHDDPWLMPTWSCNGLERPLNGKGKGGFSEASFTFSFSIVPNYRPTNFYRRISRPTNVYANETRQLFFNVILFAVVRRSKLKECMDRFLPIGGGDCTLLYKLYRFNLLYDWINGALIKKPLGDKTYGER